MIIGSFNVILQTGHVWILCWMFNHILFYWIQTSYATLHKSKNTFHSLNVPAVKIVHSAVYPPYICITILFFIRGATCKLPNHSTVMSHLCQETLQIFTFILRDVSAVLAPLLELTM